MDETMDEIEGCPLKKYNISISYYYLVLKGALKKCI